MATKVNPIKKQGLVKTKTTLRGKKVIDYKILNSCGKKGMLNNNAIPVKGKVPVNKTVKGIAQETKEFSQIVEMDRVNHDKVNMMEDTCKLTTDSISGDMDGDGVIMMVHAPEGEFDDV